MSHYANFHKPQGRYIPVYLNKRIRYCVNCNVEMVAMTHKRGSPKYFCDDCRLKLTPKQRGEIMAKMKKHRYEMLEARKTRPDLDRFIFNSPYRGKK